MKQRPLAPLLLSVAAPLNETMAAFQAELQRLLAANESAAQAVEALRKQTYPAWTATEAQAMQPPLNLNSQGTYP